MKEKKFKARVFLIQPAKSLKSQLHDLLDNLLQHENLSFKKVLLKPNLLKSGDYLAITSPEIIFLCAEYLVEKGAKVVVADSPAFGTAEKALKSIGILNDLKQLGIEVCTLSDPIPLEAGGLRIKVSKKALTSHFILNVPRLKAHCQMGITCAVKNLYGTVVGFRKAFYHVLIGQDAKSFSQIIIELVLSLPKVFTIVDATVAMDKKGPSGGRPLKMELLAGSDNPFAVDTAIYEIIRARPNIIPLWQRALEMKINGASIKEIEFPLKKPDEINMPRPFELPSQLEPINFSSIRFIKGRLKSAIRRFL